MPTIVNTHEHLQSRNEVPLLLRVMDQHEISRTVLLGSSRFTLTLDHNHGFTRLDWNNEEVMFASKRWPDRFEAWPAANPLDPRMVEKIAALVDRGARGLKLYLGHGYKAPGASDYFFHSMPLDDDRMAPLYAYAQEARVPVCLHVNCSGGHGFEHELVRVLAQFPDLRVNVPHWMLLTSKPERLAKMLREWPRLSTDVSFGHDTFLIAGLRRISRSVTALRALVMAHPDRLMFGTDFVLTDAPQKNEPWMSTRIRAYLDMLQCDTYETELIPGIVLRGLQLPKPTLSLVLGGNYARWLAGAANTLKSRPDRALVLAGDEGISADIAVDATTEGGTAAVMVAPGTRSGGRSAAMRARDPLLFADLRESIKRLARQSDPVVTVPRQEALPRDQFLARARVGRPFVITGLVNQWPIASLTPGALCERFGGTVVEARSGDYTRFGTAFTKKRESFRTTLAAYLDAGESSRSALPAYVANQRLGKLAALCHWPHYFDRRQVPRTWLGPEGTVTPLHCDYLDNLFAQVWGRKRFWLYPPDHDPFLYTAARNEVLYAARFDPEDPNFKEMPLAEHARHVECVLEPGEMLYLPAGWFHHVRALESSLSMNVWSEDAPLALS